MTETDFLKACKTKNNKFFNEISEYISSGSKFKLIRDSNGCSSLHLAIRNNNNKIAELLLKNGINPSIKDKTKKTKTAMIDAIEVGNIEGLVLCLQYVKKLPKIDGLYNVYTALGTNKKLSIQEFKKIMKILINVGYDPNKLDVTNHTILTKSIHQNNLDRVKTCLEFKEINLNNIERLPLRFAINKENINLDIIRALLKNGAKQNISASSDWTSDFNALVEANMVDNIDIFKMLIEEFDALSLITDNLIDEIIEHKEIEYLKYLWEIPRVHKFIIKHDLVDAFPNDIRELFIF